MDLTSPPPPATRAWNLAACDVSASRRSISAYARRSAATSTSSSPSAASPTARHTAATAAGVIPHTVLSGSTPARYGMASASTCPGGGARGAGSTFPAVSIRERWPGMQAGSRDSQAGTLARQTARQVSLLVR